MPKLNEYNLTDEQRRAVYDILEQRRIEDEWESLEDRRTRQALLCVLYFILGLVIGILGVHAAP